jgi:hypothetical protein
LKRSRGDATKSNSVGHNSASDFRAHAIIAVIDSEKLSKNRTTRSKPVDESSVELSVPIDVAA